LKTWYRPVLAFFIPFLIVAFAPVPSIPKKFDLIGMIRHIHSDNDHLNTVNANIVGDLNSISQLAGTSSQIDSHLHELRTGLSGQSQSLTRLGAYSRKEIDLSKSLNQLAIELSNNINTVHEYSATQNQSIANLITTANSLSKLASQIEKTNGTIANKLTTATQVSKQIASSMP
jgi:chromosome segregation ATPase